MSKTSCRNVSKCKLVLIMSVKNKPKIPINRIFKESVGGIDCDDFCSSCGSSVIKEVKIFGMKIRSLFFGTDKCINKNCYFNNLKNK